MIKTLARNLKQEKDVFQIPHSVQDAIPIQRIWPDGIFQKGNAFITAISQNVDEILRSDTARLMLANSELLVMLNQSGTDREELARLLHISKTQLSYITNVPAGHGLIRCGGVMIPFENHFPQNTKLYRLMTTKPDEFCDK